MTTDTLTPDPQPSEPPSNASAERSRRRSRLVLALVVAILVVALGAFALNALRDDGGQAQGDATPLELTLPGSDTMASCLALDVAVLADMSPAFAATATAVDGETVTLDVDRWYAGGDADVVTLRAQSGLEALIDGFDFEVGQRYLITAANGTVNFCGYSGPATPELTALFDQAFAG